MATIGIDMRALQSSYRTGVGEYALLWAHAFVSSNSEHEFVLFLNGSGDIDAVIAQLPQSPRVQIVRYHIPNILFNASARIVRYPHIDALVKRRGHPIDLLFAPNINMMRLSSRIPLVLTIHDLSFALYPQYFTRKERLWHRAFMPFALMRRARMVVTPSEHTKRDIVDVAGIAPERIAVISPGLSPQFLQRPDGVHIGRVRTTYQLPKRYILHLGTINARKNCHGLIQAFGEARRRVPELCDVKLVFAGAEGQGSDLVRRAAADDASVTLLGYVSHADKPALIAGSTLFAYPSLYEGFGFPVIEAMAMGVPVMTSHRTSLPEVGARAAYYVNPHDVIDMARGIEMVLTDSALREHMTQRGRAQAASFVWQASVKQMCQVFDRCLKKSF